MYANCNREKAEEERAQGHKGERALDKQKLQKQFNYFPILIILTSTSLKKCNKYNWFAKSIIVDC